MATRGTPARRGLNAAPVPPARTRREPPAPVSTRGVAAMYHGHQRLSLIRDIAMGEWDNKTIAERIGVEVSDVVIFASDFERDISEVRQALAGHLAIETAGLWISKKQNRLAELQRDVDDINEVIAGMRDPALPYADRLGSRKHTILLRAKIAVLTAAANELETRGKGKDSPDGQEGAGKNLVHYVIEADDAMLGSLR